MSVWRHPDLLGVSVGIRREGRDRDGMIGRECYLVKDVLQVCEGENKLFNGRISSKRNY